MPGELDDAQVRDVAELFLLHKAGGLDEGEYAGAREVVLGAAEDTARRAHVRAAPAAARKGAGAALPLYLRFSEGDVAAVELPPGGTVADLQAAAAAAAAQRGLAVGDVPPGLVYAGAELAGAGTMLSDAGLTSEATVDVVPSPQWRWERASDTVTLSDDRASAELTESRSRISPNDEFLMATAREVPAGGSADWEFVWRKERGGIRSCGVTASDALSHNNHGSQDPPMSISYEACDSRVFRRLLNKGGLEAPSFGKGDVLRFTLKDGRLTIAKNCKQLPCNPITGLGGYALRPFACFYSGNTGDAVEIRQATGEGKGS